MDIPSHLQNFENRLEDVKVVDTEPADGDFMELKNSSMESATLVGVVLNDTEEIDTPCSTEISQIKWLDGYDTEVIPDSDDEVSETIESKRSSLRRVRLIGKVTGDTDKIESSVHPPFEKLEHSNINVDDCDDGRQVTSQYACMTVFQRNDGYSITAHNGMQATKPNAKNMEISSVNNLCPANALAYDVNFIDNNEQLSEDIKAQDCGRISQSKRSDISIVYTRRRKRIRNSELNSMKDGKIPNKVEDYAGLSYVQSQEPEDISKALLFVDQYVCSNAVVSSDSSPVANITVKDKSLSMQGGKGAHNFIRLANHRNKEEESRVFEWDDSDKQYDPLCNCSQLSFRNKKNDQTYVRRSRSRNMNGKDIGNPSVLWKETEELNSLTRPHATNYMNSQFTEKFCDTKANEESKVLHQEVNDESMMMQFGAISIQEESEHVFDVGIDTQMAAEAIQALSYATIMECNGVEADKCQHKMLNQSLEGCLKRTIAEDWPFPKKVRSASRGDVSRRKENRRFPIYGNHDFKIKSSNLKERRTKKWADENMDGRNSNCSSIADFMHKQMVTRAKGGFDSKDNSRPFMSTEQSSLHNLGRHSVNELRKTGIVHDNDSGARKTMFAEHVSGCTIALQDDCADKNRFPSTMDDGDGKDGPTTLGSKKLISENAVSPCNLNDKYHEQCGKKKASPLARTRELARLGFTEAMPEFTFKDPRKRKAMANIQVLLSKNLDEHTHNQQTKIMKRLGVSMTSCSLNASHFISDKFVRTRNMLEFIALGKPVVNHMWLESCQQAGCYIDETKYILRDIKREQELGFRLPISLDRARKQPLLEGYKAIITPNAKPGQDLLTSLVKIVRGEVVDMFTDKIMSKKTILNKLLIFACEEDREYCLPFLEKGASAYSSELLLNGIIIQKLEFERHKLFTGHVIRH